MKTLDERLNQLRVELKSRAARIMIMGLGSVGYYLLDYLMSKGDEQIEICVVGRNADKLQSDVNIVKVASLIRGQNKSKIFVRGNVDFDDVGAMAETIKEYCPDIIVNSSRAYAGLKYGSISWKTVRAYGIWTPLSIKYVKNIMEAYERAGSDAIVINTSYSDAVIPWLKSAGKAYPDFGSGNINHLVYRFKLSAGELLQIKDYWNIDITFAVAHFHDVVISKEGQTEGVEMLLDVRYRGQPLNLTAEEIISNCGIPMPVDAKRNMMNASSNFEIIMAILDAVREQKKVKLHCPGVFGEIGGYPVMIDGEGQNISAYISEERFDMETMRKKNRESIYFDGIEKIEDGALYYTDELIGKVQKVFGVDLNKKIDFEEIDKTAAYLINEIIEKNR